MSKSVTCHLSLVTACDNLPALIDCSSDQTL